MASFPSQPFFFRMALSNMHSIVFSFYWFSCEIRFSLMCRLCVSTTHCQWDGSMDWVPCRSVDSSPLVSPSNTTRAPHFDPTAHSVRGRWCPSFGWVSPTLTYCLVEAPDVEDRLLCSLSLLWAEKKNPVIIELSPLDYKSICRHNYPHFYFKTWL